MLFGHGLGKVSRLFEGGGFADPIGVGPELSLAWTIFAEVICSALVILGLFTRVAVLPLVVTMFVAFAIVHGADPWAKKELAFLFAVAFAMLALTGPGRFSLDARLFGHRSDA